MLRWLIIVMLAVIALLVSSPVGMLVYDYMGVHLGVISAGLVAALFVGWVSVEPDR